MNLSQFGGHPKLVIPPGFVSLPADNAGQLIAMNHHHLPSADETLPGRAAMPARVKHSPSACVAAAVVVEPDPQSRADLPATSELPPA